MHIAAPTFTQTPNDLFDHWLPKLCESELKVLLIILRKTFGWHKTRDYISISMLAKKTGMMEETVIKATKSLQKKGLILKEVIGPNGKQQTFYELIVEEDSNNSYPSAEPRGPLGSDPGVSTEAQNKSSFLKEKQQQKKVAKAPVVVSSSIEEKDYSECDAAARQWMKKLDESGTSYTEKAVIKHFRNNACKPNQSTSKEDLIKAFKNGSLYEGKGGEYECIKDDLGIGFLPVDYYAPQPYTVYFKSKTFKCDLDKLLEKLLIKPIG